MFTWVVELNGAQQRNSDAAVAVEHNVYSFGGFYINNINTNNIMIVVDVFNTVSLRWKNLPPVTTERGHCHLHVPTKRFDHTAVLTEDVIYIFGGFKYTNQYRSEVCNELYAFDVDTHRWLKPMVHGTLPEASRGHSACVLGKAMYVYGGSGRTNDMYKLDITTMFWSFINSRGTPEPASMYHSATIIRTKMFVFGGRGVQDNNIRVFDTETNCWLGTPSAQLLPEGRWGHSAFAYNEELYIFGGRNWTLDRNFNDLWKFNPETFSCKKVEPKGKGPCPMFGMCCCMVGDHIILFGGRNTPDLYILNLSPRLKTLCKLAVIQYNMEQSVLPHNIRWELAAMNNSKQTSSSPRQK